jgi:hypothetical protein
MRRSCVRGEREAGGCEGPGQEEVSELTARFWKTIEIGPVLERFLRDLLKLPAARTPPQPGNGQTPRGLPPRLELKTLRALIDDLNNNAPEPRSDRETAEKFGVGRSTVNVLQRLRLRRPDLLQQVFNGESSIANAQNRMRGVLRAAIDRQCSRGGVVK